MLALDFTRCHMDDISQFVSHKVSQRNCKTPESFVTACYKARRWRSDDSGTVQLTLNSSAYRKILDSNVRPSVLQLKLGPNWVMHHEMTQSTATNLQREGWNRKGPKFCRGPVNVQTSDLPTEMLWWDLKRDVHERTSKSNAVNKSGPEFLYDDEKLSRNDHLELQPLNEILQAVFHRNTHSPE